MASPRRPVSGVRGVAAAAGVSVATVSRYVNHKLVLPKVTAALIESAILALGYQANPHARRLSLGRSETIGLVIPDIANPFFARLADAIQQEAEAAGFEVAISTTRNRLGRELAALTRLGNERAEGTKQSPCRVHDKTLTLKHPLGLVEDRKDFQVAISDGFHAKSPHAVI